MCLEGNKGTDDSAYLTPVFTPLSFYPRSHRHAPVTGSHSPLSVHMHFLVHSVPKVPRGQCSEHSRPVQPEKDLQIKTSCLFSFFDWLTLILYAEGIQLCCTFRWSMFRPLFNLRSVFLWLKNSCKKLVWLCKSSIAHLFFNVQFLLNPSYMIKHLKVVTNVCSLINSIEDDRALYMYNQLTQKRNYNGEEVFDN